MERDRDELERYQAVEYGGDGWQGTARVCEACYPEFRRASSGITINQNTNINLSLQEKAREIYSDFGISIDV